MQSFWFQILDGRVGCWLVGARVRAGDFGGYCGEIKCSLAHDDPHLLGLNSLARDGLDSFLPCAIGQVNSSVSLLELICDVGELFDKAT
jgi:hypothetical protein